MILLFYEAYTCHSWIDLAFVTNTYVPTVLDRVCGMVVKAANAKPYSCNIVHMVVMFVVSTLKS